MRAVAALVLAALVAATAPAFASAPAGKPPADAAEAYAKAQNVFLGKVVDVKKDDLGFMSQATVLVLAGFKGPRGGKVMVSGRGGPTYPARVFAKGDVYLFYLGGDMRADSAMNRVLPSVDAAADLTFLRTQPKAPAPKPSKLK